MPAVGRQLERGVPCYDDRPRWHPGEDRFVYAGGGELVPVSDADALAFDGAPPPPEAAGWQQYRPQVGTLRASPASPPVGANAAAVALYNVNADGLVDVVDTDATHVAAPDGRPAVGVYCNGFPPCPCPCPRAPRRAAPRSPRPPPCSPTSPATAWPSS